jgi:hypothetical protein
MPASRLSSLASFKHNLTSVLQTYVYADCRMAQSIIFIPTVCSVGIGFKFIVLLSLSMPRDNFVGIFGPEEWREQAAPKVINDLKNLI